LTLHLAVEIRILFVLQSFCLDILADILHVNWWKYSTMEVFCFQREWGSNGDVLDKAFACNIGSWGCMGMNRVSLLEMGIGDGERVQAGS
jgi:hypothetical protein